MKKQILPFVGMLSLLLTSGSALAQSNDLRADIPFKFQINGHVLPAGSYRISSVGSMEQAVAVVNENTRDVQIILPHRVFATKPATNTKLVFRAYGDRYFLSQMWVAGHETGRELPKTAVETRVAKEQSADQVFVAAALE